MRPLTGRQTGASNGDSLRCRGCSYNRMLHPNEGREPSLHHGGNKSVREAFMMGGTLTETGSESDAILASETSW